jgi:DNA-binding response OmpR family regulator
MAGQQRTPHSSRTTPIVGSGEPPTMLLVEPDEDLGRELVNAARRRGLRTSWSRDGGNALLRAGATKPDLVVVAARLPILDSSTVIRTIRHRWKMCILVGATPCDEALARAALEAGAHATVARPYDLNTVLRLGLGADEIHLRPGLAGVMTVGPVMVDLGRHEVRLDDREVQLTTRELQLLAYLIRRDGDVANQNEISAAVWGHPADSNTIAVHIKRLRDKLGIHPIHGQLIITIRGAGYRLTPSLYADRPSAAS